MRPRSEGWICMSSTLRSRPLRRGIRAAGWSGVIRRDDASDGATRLVDPRARRSCSNANTTSCTRSRRRELREDAADVRLHRRLAEELGCRDLRVAESARREHEDLALARGELATGRRRRPPRRCPRPKCANSSRVADAAITALPGVHGADGGEQELGVGVLQHEAARSGADGPRRVLVEVEGREHDDPRRRRPSRRRRRGSARSLRCRR